MEPKKTSERVATAQEAFHALRKREQSTFVRWLDRELAPERKRRKELKARRAKERAFHRAADGLTTELWLRDILIGMHEKR